MSIIAAFQIGGLGCDWHHFVIQQDTGRDVDEIDFVLNQLDVFDRFSEFHPAGNQFLGAQPKFDGELVADFGADAIQQFPGKTGPVCQAAAVLVGSVIEQGG